MKVMHLLQSSFYSGAENVVCQIMKLFSNEDKIQMVYVSPKGSIKETIESKGFRYIGLDEFSIINIRKIINKENPNIVHAHDISASILASIATIGTHVRVVSHVHVNNDNMKRFNLKSLLFLLSSIRYKHIFWVSPSCFESYYFRNRLKSKSTILCNVMDKREILARANELSDAKVYDVIYVGRIAYQKNPNRLLLVLSELIKVLPNVKIGVVGDGALFKKTKEQALKFGISDNVEFLGFKSNPLVYLHHSKVMVMTSLYEGLPMTVLESLALGVPIVSTPVDGLLNVIENGKNGYLSNDNARLVEYLYSIVTDAKIRETLSKGAIRKFDEICDLKQYKEEISKVYMSMV